ncbi:cytokinin oxidase [Legionella busanensis]|uniref:Cytokinin oxidase n=1 Tax=Legionella busanensis TaxID=190655 RepID=A0A378JJ05_9GAMM|nr:FAD-binding protein [Legionella busanensis]STX51286.1 cytokinin oxidase [Legionella busanensis]
MRSKIDKILPEIGKFSAGPAAMIERTYLSEPGSLFGKLWKEIKLRTIYGGLFLPAAAIDMFTSLGIGIRYSIGVFTRSDEVQDDRIVKLKKYATLFSKNVLALLASPVGLFKPKLVQLHFNSDNPTQGLVSGGKLHQDLNTKIEYPKNVDNVIDIIKDAAKNGHKIMPIGSGRSQGKQYFPEGAKGEQSIAIDMRYLNTVEINAKEQTATIGAGAHWEDVQNYADKLGLALEVQQASNVFSAGGSVGTNIHGWNHRTGVLSNTILSMDIINAQGEKQTITPKEPLFHFITGGLGLFGIVTSITLQLTNNKLLKEVGTEVKLSDYVNHFRRNVEPNENIHMHLYRLSLDPKDLLGTGVAVDYVQVDNSKQVKTENLIQEGTYGSRINRILVNMANQFAWMRDKYWQREYGRLLRNDSPPMTVNQIMQPPINAMFNNAVSEAEWLQEYFIPEENLRDFLYALSRLLTSNQVALINASVRFVKQHNASPMSYAHDGDRFAIVLCFNQPLQHSQVVKAKKWLREAQNLAVEHGGTYYLPYQHISNPKDFNRAYPRAAEAMRMKHEVDPNELFVSGFYQKYLAPIYNNLFAHKSTRPNYFNELMKTKEMKERFSGFLSVVLKRVEAKELYNLLEDVMRYNDSHAEIYQELCRRLPEISANALADFRHILTSLSEIKNDLTEQAVVLLDGTKEINGLVEIGYPGRFVDGFKKHFKVTGNIVAVYENPQLSDYVQTGFPRPYHKFAKLDYSDPNLHKLPDNSADVITCYIGLHHFPENKVKFFLQEVRRVLRAEGHFLLVDHDVRNQSDMVMAHGAHMIFNAVIGASLQDELHETRLFRSMEHWKSLCKEAGLNYDVSGADVEMIRAGDPSRNRMVCFIKPKLELVNKERATLAQQVSSTSPILTQKKEEPLQSWRCSSNMPISLSQDTLFSQNENTSAFEIGKKEEKEETTQLSAIL